MKEEIKMLPCPICNENINLNFQYKLREGGKVIFGSIFCGTCDYEGPFIQVATDDSEHRNKIIKSWNKQK